MEPARKRKRTTRACDICRQHRIRCEYPPSGGDCKHCLTFGLLCEAVAPAPKDHRLRFRGVPSTERELGSIQQGLEPGYLGPSSSIQLLRDILPDSEEGVARDFFDQQDVYVQAFPRDSNPGVLYGRSAEASGPEIWARETLAVKSVELKLASRVGSETILEDLFERFQTRIIPLFPVVSVTESVGSGPPPERFYRNFNRHSDRSKPHSPLPKTVKLVQIAIASLAPEVPDVIRSNILIATREQLRHSALAQLTETSSLAVVQLWATLGISEDIHSDDAAEAISLSWQRAGRAVRTAVELGLHRKVSVDVVPLGQVHRRQRVWASCMIVDRWLTVRLGQTLSFTHEDCDVEPPFWYPDDMNPRDVTVSRPCFRFLAELTSLSVLLERAYQLTSTPYGLSRATDTTLYTFQNDLDGWYAALPDTWPYNEKRGPLEGRPLFKLLSVAVEYTFIRPFRLPSVRPPHIHFKPAIGRWERTFAQAVDSIAWLLTEEGRYLFNVWGLLVYPAFICVIVVAFDAIGGDSPPTPLVQDTIAQAVTLFESWAAVKGARGQFESRVKLLEAVGVLQSKMYENQGNDFDVDAFWSSLQQ